MMGRLAARDAALAVNLAAPAARAESAGAQGPKVERYPSVGTKPSSDFAGALRVSAKPRWRLPRRAGPAHSRTRRTPRRRACLPPRQASKQIAAERELIQELERKVELWRRKASARGPWRPSRGSRKHRAPPNTARRLGNCTPRRPHSRRTSSGSTLRPSARLPSKTRR